jgi:hypothetical protein
MRSTPHSLFSDAAEARRSADLLLAWIDAAEDAAAAYLAWGDADPRHHTEAFVVYRAALDREEAAARALEQSAAALRQPVTV